MAEVDLKGGVELTLSQTEKLKSKSKDNLNYSFGIGKETHYIVIIK